MNKATIARATAGGVFIGVSSIGLLYNTLIKYEAVFIVNEVVGLVAGCALIFIAFKEA